MKLMNLFLTIKFNIKRFIEKDIKQPTDTEKRVYKKCFIGASIFAVCVFSFLLLQNTFLANAVSEARNEAEGFVTDIVKLVVPGSTVIAVCLVAINIVTIMTTKNQKKIESSIAWIKGICVAWACLQCINVLILIIKLAVTGKSTGWQANSAYNGLLGGQSANGKFTPLFGY